MQYYNKQMCGYIRYMVKIRLLRIYQLKNQSINQSISRDKKCIIMGNEYIKRQTVYHGNIWGCVTFKH